MIRSAFEAYSPGKPSAVAAPPSSASLPENPPTLEAKIMPMADWDMMFCAVRDRLKTLTAVDLDPAHEVAQRKMQLVSLECAGALELLHKMLLTERLKNALLTRKKNGENN